MRDEERRFAAQRTELDSSLVFELRSEVDAAVTVPAGASNGGIDDAAVHAVVIKVEAGLPPGVAELYNPSRTSLGAQQFSIASGVAMDLRTGWDFTLHRHRQAALEYVRRVKLRLIIGSPECAQFSQLEHLDGRVWNARRAEVLKEAKKHVVSAVQI